MPRVKPGITIGSSYGADELLVIILTFNIIGGGGLDSCVGVNDHPPLISTSVPHCQSLQEKLLS